MPLFPHHLLQEAIAQGLRPSPFDWTATPLAGRPAAKGTALIGDPQALEAFRERVAASTGAGEEVRAILVPPDTQTVESVIYFPDWHLEVR